MAEATGLVRHEGKKQYLISEKTNFAEKHLVFSRPKQGLNWYIIDPRRAIEWQIAGQPPIRLMDQEGSLKEDVYDRIVGGAKIIPDNLRKSFSGLCLAGRVAGGTVTREACASIRFRNETDEHGLEELLTVHGWSSSHGVSRMTFFNARTEQLDRCASAPALVVADGDACFLKVIGRSEFQRSDVIGVIHRTMERDHLEAVGNKLLGLRQWYGEDSETRSRLQDVPRGISILILRRRTP